MHVVRDYQLQEVPDDDEYDLALEQTSRLYGSHTNNIPIASGVQTARLFYGGRFENQYTAQANGEAPLVQNLDDSDKQGRSFDEILGEHLGARRAKKPGQVVKDNDDEIVVRYDDGEEDHIELYRDFPMNQKSGLWSRKLVKVGDRVEPNKVVAASNFTDDNGVAAGGLNAKIGVAPYKGWSMDDATPVSESFAKRMVSDQFKLVRQDVSDQMKMGKNHFVALLPQQFDKTKLENLDDNGIVKAGTILQPGDPIFLATMPKTVSSADVNLGRLSKAQRQSRRDASQTWDGNTPATVVEARKTRDGIKVILRYSKPLDKGDKIVLRQGAKATVSTVLPDDQMPRGEDGEPLDLLLNPLSLNSRANPATSYELRLANVARKMGSSMKVPAYLPKGTSWRQYVADLEKQHGVSSKQRIYDPVADRELDNPITVGYGFVRRLHHTSESKSSARGIGSYDCFDDITEVLTDRGWVAWPAVKPTDLLCTPEQDMTSAKFEMPSRLVSYDFDGELMRYESPYLDWAVTENHKFMRYNKSGKTDFVTAKRLSEIVRVSIPQFGFVCAGSNPAVKIIPPVSSGRLHRHKEPLVIDFLDYAAFAGWWIAEGCSDLAKGRVLISQNATVNPAHSEEIRMLLDRLTGKKSTTSKGWRLDDRRLAEFTQTMGSSCYDKRIPRDIIEAGKEAVAAFLDAYTKGDGTRGEYEKSDSRTKKNLIHCVGSASVKLMDDFQEMLMRNGMGLIVKETHAQGRIATFSDGRSYACEAFYSGRIHLQRKKATVVPSKGMPRYAGEWSSMPYAGKVYCATTRTGLLVVRRNGKPCVTGNSNELPAKGGGDNAQAKRYSGLENTATMSAGAYSFIRGNATIRGQKQHDFWQSIREGKTPRPPSRPFVFDKFLHLLQGAGINPRDKKDGRLKLAPWTDDDLDSHNPVEIENGELVDLRTFEARPGGLFDQRLVDGNRWGRIRLPRPVINPAMEESVRVLLGMTKKDLEAVLDGRQDLPEELIQKVLAKRRASGITSA